MDSQVRVQQVTRLPKLNTSAVREYEKWFPEVLKHGTRRECRELVSCFVDSIKLRPSADEAHKQIEPTVHEITINFKAMPAQFVKGLGAGACFVNLDQ